MASNPLARRICMTMAAVAAAIPCGCFSVPNSGPSGRSIRELAGDADSDKVIRLGQSDRATVIQTLGAPGFRTKRELAIGYVNRRVVGYWFPFAPGPCGLAGGGPDIRTEYLFLEFDSSGLLRRIGRNEDREGWPGFIKSVPDHDDSAPR